MAWPTSLQAYPPSAKRGDLRYVVHHINKVDGYEKETTRRSEAFNEAVKAQTQRQQQAANEIDREVSDYFT